MHGMHVHAVHRLMCVPCAWHVQVLCPTAGRAVLSFDNSGLWLTPKLVHYRLQVLNDLEAL